MRKEFERSLKKGIVPQTKKEMGQEVLELDEALQKEIDELVESSRYGHYVEEIRWIQFEKQAIMAKLKSDLSRLKRGEPQEIKDGSLIVTYDPETNLFEVEGQEVSLAELESFWVWRPNSSLYFDPDSVPVSAQKRLLLVEAKTKLRALLDIQICNYELSQLGEADRRREAYIAIKEREKGTEQVGVLAERMVSDLIVRISEQYDLGIEVVPSDPHTDVEYKVDFVIKVKKEKRQQDKMTTETGSFKQEVSRGARVESGNEEQKKIKAVQFTTNTSERARRKKNHQLAAMQEHYEEVLESMGCKDIVLVMVPIDYFREALNSWDESLATNPDKQLPGEVQATLVRELLYGLIDGDKLLEIVEDLRSER